MRTPAVAALIPSMWLGWLALAPPARAAEALASGGSGQVQVSGETGAYLVATSSIAVKLQARGAGELTVKLRALLPQGAAPTDGIIARIKDNGGELAHVSLSVYPAGAFVGRKEIAPGGPSVRSLHLEEGAHLISVEVGRGGSVGVQLLFRPLHAGHGGSSVARRAQTLNQAIARFGGALEPLSEPAPADLDATPLDATPLTATPLTATPLTATPLAVNPPVAAETTTQPLAAAPPPLKTDTQQLFPLSEPTAKVSTSERSDRTLALVLLGGAVLCGAGAATSVGLGVSTFASYNSTPETQGGVATNRAGKLSTANSEMAVGEVLGAASLALLLGAGVSLFF